MARALQKRTLQTRARLIGAAEEIIAEVGFTALRVEEVVLRAGTAKGTFFSHFKDKDALMDLIIGARLNSYLDDLEALPAPQSVTELTDRLLPMTEFMVSERYVLDVILRYSGAAAIEEIGPIAASFGRTVELFIDWLQAHPFRRDISPEIQAEGVHAFLMQAVATQFCALHNAHSFRERLQPYLQAWLYPQVEAAG